MGACPTFTLFPIGFYHTPMTSITATPLYTALPHVRITDAVLLTPTTTVGEILVYGPAECPGCTATLDFFVRKNMPATKVTVAAGDTAHTYITQDLGYLQAPVVTVQISNPDTDTDNNQDTQILHWAGVNRYLMHALSRTNF